MADRKTDTAFVGFDSAWVGNLKKPGAICSISFDGKRFRHFAKPQLVGFEEAVTFVAQVGQRNRLTLVAIDQPTIVKNLTGMRPAEKIAASVIGWLGGGVQPANRKRVDMFGVEAPIWKFKRGVHAIENPELSRREKRGRFILEVFPALALPSINHAFCGRSKAPKYNPDNRKKYRQSDWKAGRLSSLR